MSAERPPLEGGMTKKEMNFLLCSGARMATNPLDGFDKSQLIELLSELGLQLHFVSKGKLTLRTQEHQNQLKVTPCKCGCTIDIQLKSRNPLPRFLDDSMEQRCMDLRNRIETCTQELHQLSRVSAC